MRRAVLLGALALAGCSEPFELDVDPTFSPGRQVAIEQAAHEWLSVGASLGRIRVVQGDPGDPGWLAVHIDGTVIIRPEIADCDFYAIALHEFGHAAAETHTHHAGEGVMRADLPDMVPCISRDDLRFAGLEGEGTCGGHPAGLGAGGSR